MDLYYRHIVQFSALAMEQRRARQNMPGLIPPARPKRRRARRLVAFLVRFA